MDGVVFRPGGLDGTCEGEDVLGVEAVIGGGRGGVPFPAGVDGFSGVFAHKGGEVGVIGGAADVLQAPVKGLDAAIVVSGPAAVLVASDFALEPMHESSCKFLVYSC